MRNLRDKQNLAIIFVFFDSRIFWFLINNFVLKHTLIWYKQASCCLAIQLSGFNLVALVKSNNFNLGKKKSLVIKMSVTKLIGWTWGPQYKIEHLKSLKFNLARPQLLFFIFVSILGCGAGRSLFLYLILLAVPTQF